MKISEEIKFNGTVTDDWRHQQNCSQIGSKYALFQFVGVYDVMKANIHHKMVLRYSLFKYVKYVILCLANPTNSITNQRCSIFKLKT